MANFSIPNTGYTIGTCGWLAKGLADGTITIRPGTTKGGKGGLWLHCGEQQGCLAIFNEFDLTQEDYRDADRFCVVDEDFAGRFPLTNACENYLRDAAEDWCDAANGLRENDSPEKMPTLSVE